jgi:tetratricopeptide (TPR) repeat protein
LTAALDNWADNRRASRKAGDTSWKRLFAIARAADPDPWRNRVRAALEQGDAKTLNQLAASANVRELPVQSLSLLVYRGHLDLALEKSLLHKAQREHPDDFTLNFQLAWGSHPEEAIRFYSAALAAQPKNAAARYFLGRALWCRGKRVEAIAEFRKVFEVNSEYAEAYNGVAWVLATCAEPSSRNPRWAVELAMKAVELMPEDAPCWNTLGVAHYRVGNLQEAVAALNKAEQLAPSRYLAWNDFFLAMAHWRLGQKEQARKEYEQAVEWVQKKEPKNEELRRFRAEAEALLRISHR